VTGHRDGTNNSGEAPVDNKSSASFVIKSEAGFMPTIQLEVQGSAAVRRNL